MAFVEKDFDIGPMAAKGVPKQARYISAADNMVTIAGATYFDSSIVSELLEVGDIIQIAGTDGAGFRRVSSKASSADITLAAIN